MQNDFESLLQGIEKLSKGEAAAIYAAKLGRVMPLHSIFLVDGKPQCSCRNDECDKPGKHPLIKSAGAEASTDPATVARWWKKWPFANIGLWLEGSGLAVLDIDVTDGKDGAAQLVKVLEGQPLPATAAVATPSGGKHLYYRDREGLPNKSNALGKGLDVWRDKHYVILPPSSHKSGGTYLWDQRKEIADWPDVLMPRKRAVGRPRTRPAPPFVFDIEDADDRARLGHALTFIDASDRETWVKVGYALAVTFKWADKGFQLFREWAATAKNYNAKQTHLIYHRDSKNDPPEGGGITVASVFDLAKKNPNYVAWQKDDDRLRFVNLPDNRGLSLDALNAKVIEAKVPIYRRGSMLFDIIKVESLTEVDRKRIEAHQLDIPPDTPILRAVTPSRLEDIVSRRIRYFERKGEALRSGPFSKGLLLAYLERGEWPGIAQFRAFISHPTVRSMEDRSFILSPGLDKASGLYLTDSFPLELPKTVVSRIEAQRASKVVLSPFREYRFFDQHHGPAIILAAVITSLTRHCYRTVPGIALEAARSGSGKTKAAQAIGCISLGRRLPKITYSANDEEMEKRLGAVKMMGVRDLLLDNVKDRMESQSIETMMTESHSSYRVLGRSEVVELPNDGVLYVTGNGMVMNPDMRRRFLTINIDSGGQIEAARTGRFTFDPPDEALRDRRRIINAVLTILKGYEDCQGQRKMNEGRGRNRRPVASFEDWSYVRDVILWLDDSYPDLGQVLEDNIATDDDEKSYDKDQVLEWMARHGNGLSAAEIVDRLLDPDKHKLKADEAIRVRGIFIRGKHSRSQSDSLTPETISHGLKRLELLNAWWDAVIDGRPLVVAIRKKDRTYTVERRDKR